MATPSAEAPQDMVLASVPSSSFQFLLRCEIAQFCTWANMNLEKELRVTPPPYNKVTCYTLEKYCTFYKCMSVNAADSWR